MQRRNVLATLSAAIGALLGCAHSTVLDARPGVRFVAVEQGVRLEVLDWGGTGRPLILLAGGGNTAHVFNDFGPKLTADYHVYALTRRGFGASGWAPSARTGDRLRDDVLAVLDTLKLERPVLAGHSIAGAELSAVAALRPDRIAGLVYLDAAYPYAFDNGKGMTFQEMPELRGLRSPTPGDSDLASFSALQRWSARTFGFRTPATELQQLWDSTADGRPTEGLDFPGSSMFATILAAPTRYADIPVPALVIFAHPHLQEAWMAAISDPDLRARADAYFTSVDALTERQAKAIEEGSRAAHVVRLRGLHYIFVSNEQEVMRAMRAFVARLDQR